MLGKNVPEGAIYYASSKRRRVLPITDELRQRVGHTADAIRAMLASEKLPPVLPADQVTKRCKACSLADRCQPQATSAGIAHAHAQLFDPDA